MGGGADEAAEELEGGGGGGAAGGDGGEGLRRGSTAWPPTKSWPVETDPAESWPPTEAEPKPAEVEETVPNWAFWANRLVVVTGGPHASANERPGASVVPVAVRLPTVAEPMVVKLADNVAPEAPPNARTDANRLVDVTAVAVTFAIVTFPQRSSGRTRKGRSRTGS